MRILILTPKTEIELNIKKTIYYKRRKKFDAVIIDEYANYPKGWKEAQNAR